MEKVRKRSLTNGIVGFLLKLFARAFNKKPNRRAYLVKNHDGSWLNWSIGFRSVDDRVNKALQFEEGRVSVLDRVPGDVDVWLEFPDTRAVVEMVKATPDEILNMVRVGRIVIRGNSVLGTLFNFYVSLLMGKSHQKKLDRRRAEDRERVAREYSACGVNDRGEALKAEMGRRRRERLEAPSVDPGVKFLEDPYLSKYDVGDFPRLERFLEVHFTRKPEICPERAKLVTDWFKENGFEEKPDGTPWVPALRQAGAYKYLMENRRPIIREGDLLAGTTTSKEIGVVLYPDLIGTLIWGELNSVSNRLLNPYDVSEETRELLHHEVNPFWIRRNLKEWVRVKHGDPLCQRLDDRFAVYFLWKTVSLSHTIADFPRLLKLGTTGIIAEVEAELEGDPGAPAGKRDELRAMVTCLEGLNEYALHLSEQAAREATAESDPDRRAELEHIAETCSRVPAHPARTLDEAVQAVWTGWVGLHMENTNAGLSIGRLDQWLQPYFEADISKLSTPEDREEYVKHALELCGCFFMRCTDHLPLIPDIGNYLFGGSSSDQAVTLGGVTPDGGDAVCDMTYVLLKVTEILNIRDPNVNARYHPGVNTDAYLKRLCEVNYVTAATPSMHNDVAVMKSLEEFGYAVGDLRDWSATGCVEPTLSGKHMGHTNCMMMSMVAALEMALNDGRHPLMGWDVGPKTGRVEDGAFETFEDFFDAFKAQYQFLIDQAVEYNNILGEAHQYVRPTPLLSALIQGSIESGRDVTAGGAKYNSSGAACIGLADVTDSLMAVKTLVFDEGRVTFPELKRAVDANFEGYPELYAMVRKKVPLFGSGSREALEMANRLVDFTHEAFGRHQNYRGGSYTAGFWSMSNHVAFGNLAGALPSGRLAGKAFTPGLTPQAHASPSLVDNIKDVARLHVENVTNNMAFNVKVVPGGRDSHERVVDRIFSYVKSYFELGGMQMQLNVVTSDMLGDAMVHPENYRNLLVRISGYNAYFVTLNRDMQLELIERAEYGV
ncbi:MAG: pyruvate formate lyase family protein [Promethearchaeota archaeon]